MPARALRVHLRLDVFDGCSVLREGGGVHFSSTREDGWTTRSRHFSSIVLGAIACFSSVAAISEVRGTATAAVAVKASSAFAVPRTLVTKAVRKAGVTTPIASAATAIGSGGGRK